MWGKRNDFLVMAHAFGTLMGFSRLLFFFWAFFPFAFTFVPADASGGTFMYLVFGVGSVGVIAPLRLSRFIPYNKTDRGMERRERCSYICTSTCVVT
jgi:hypothetical protein